MQRVVYIEMFNFYKRVGNILGFNMKSRRKCFVIFKTLKINEITLIIKNRLLNSF